MCGYVEGPGPLSDRISQQARRKARIVRREAVAWAPDGLSRPAPLHGVGRDRWRRPGARQTKSPVHMPQLVGGISLSCVL